MHTFAHHPDAHAKPPESSPRSGPALSPDSGPRTEDRGLPFPFPLFNPPPHITDAILRDLGDPDITYREVAEEHGQTAESLSAFLARPDIAERMRNVESGISQRARFVAIANLTTCAKAMQASVCEYLLAAKIREEEPADEDIHPGPKHAELIRRQAETARKATLVLLRIAKFDPTPRVARLSEPGRCNCQCSKPLTPTPRPTRTLESLLSEFATLPAPPHKGEVASLRAGGGEPPEPQSRDDVTAPDLTAPPISPQVRRGGSHSSPTQVPSPSAPSAPLRGTSSPHAHESSAGDSSPDRFSPVASRAPSPLTPQRPVEDPPPREALPEAHRGGTPSSPRMPNAECRMPSPPALTPSPDSS